MIDKFDGMNNDKTQFLIYTGKDGKISLNVRLMIQYGLLNNRWRTCFSRLGRMWLSISNTFMRKKNWKKVQLVGNSDRFKQKGTDRSKESCLSTISI